MLMSSVKTAVSAVALAGGLVAGMLGLGAAVASAQPPPPPAPEQGEIPPDWAPRKPADFFDGHPVVWSSLYGGRWGVFINGGFLMLSSNQVINAG